MKKFLFTLLAILALAVPSFAQTATVTSTTTTAAIAASDNFVNLTSGTGVAAGVGIFVDKEMLRVVSVAAPFSTTRPRVARGQDGTRLATHVSGVTVYIGPTSTVAGPGPFWQSDPPAGTCVLGNEQYSRRINTLNGKHWKCINSWWVDLSTERTITWAQGATVANAVTTPFFIADQSYVITQIQAVWGTAESTGAMDINVEKLTGTTAVGSGTAVLSAAIDATGTANTVATGTLSTTAATLNVAPGNRLGVTLTATPNEVKNIVVTVKIAPVATGGS